MMDENNIAPSRKHTHFPFRHVDTAQFYARAGHFQRSSKGRVSGAFVLPLPTISKNQDKRANMYLVFPTFLDVYSASVIQLT